MKITVLRGKVRRRKTRKGFSLVATILMLSLLMILALGMTTLSAVTLRTSSKDRDLMRARANARLALQLAIGELQELAGPDKRVTAPSSVLGDNVRPHLTGVWEGWKWDGEGGAPNWKNEKDSRFKGWLASSARRGNSRDLEFVKKAESEQRTVRLVAPGKKDDVAVEAEVVELGGNRSLQKGGFAWAAFDQSQKASVSLSSLEKEDADVGRLDRLSVAHEPGFAAVRAFDWKALSNRGSERRFMTSLGQSRLLGLDEEDVSFHDAAVGSYGLLTDVAAGGLASDLSSLFKDEKLPGSHRNRFLYSGRDAPLVPVPARFPKANPFPSPDPSWALLHSHYRAYTRLSGGSGAPEYVANAVPEEARPAPIKNVAGTVVSEPTTEEVLHAAAFNKQQIAPVIAKAQFVFSLTFGYNDGTLPDMRSSGRARSTPASLRDNYITWLVIDPVITLWNPYNVPLRFTGATIELYRIPLAFRLYKNGKRINEEYTLLTNAHTKEDFATRQKRYYLLHLLPDEGQTSLAMQPGEHIVFTGQEWRLHGSHSYNEIGLEMRPGFNPPAGAQSSPHIGGVTTQNLFVDAAGQTSGRDYNKDVRTVAVKGGDLIGIDVRPERIGDSKGVNSLEETGNKEVTGFLKYYLGSAHSSVPSSQRKLQLVGGIELDYGKDKERENLPEFLYENRDLPEIVVNSAIPKESPINRPAEAALKWKEPFLIATFQQKTEKDSKFPSRSWINNAPTNLFSSAGLDQTEEFAHQQYEFKWEPMTDWPPDSPTIEISNERNRGYGGSGIYAQTGTELATFASLPVEPAHSLGQFSHAPLNAGGQLPLTTRPVANSFAPALISPDHVKESADSRTYLDHSYLANNALFDSWFLSTAADHPGLAGGLERGRDQLLDDFFRRGKKLPNSRFVPYLGHETPSEIIGRISDDGESYRNIAANLLIEAPFNVNSTRVAAWQALLASNFGGEAPLADGGSASEDGVPVLRNLPSVGGNFGSSGGYESDRLKWTGHRRLSAEQIESIADKIVEGIKERGPFQSLAEFVNRQPGGGNESLSGVVQAAIDASGVNDAVLDSEFRFSAGSGANLEAGSGNTADGAPGMITQADLLTPLLPQLTARGDTFVIRAYGEASDSDGRVVRAWCEATVQRHPDFVDPADAATATPVSTVNQTFGRRFEVVAFRWLKPSDI